MHDKLTARDIERMQEEIDYRKCVVRAQAIEAVKEARAFGDLSENFEYKAAKQAKNENESRIRYLQNMIATAHVISGESPKGVVGMNDTVRLYFTDDEQMETVKITTAVRSNSLQNRITADSPLGAAIFGHRVGDRCRVTVSETYAYDVVITEITDSGEEDDPIRRY